MPRRRVSRKKMVVSKKSEEVLKSDPKTRAFITTFFSIVGFIVALLIWKKDKYVMFYARQSLVLFIVMLIAALINAIFLYIPIIGAVISVFVNIFVVILWIFSWVYSLSGEKKDVPLIGEYSKKINL